MAGRNNHTSYLTDLLGHAKKGGNDLKTKEQPGNQPGTSLTAEQIANAQNILGMIGQNSRSQREQNNRATDHYHSPNIAIDIHGRPNYFNEPVYYNSPGTTTSRVSGIHYTVSDFGSKCNKCTRHRACDRHRDPHWIKTDISLCKGNHIRMALSWDVSDPENRKKSWKLSIEEKYDHFFNSERERREHDDSKRKERDGGVNDEGETEGCSPMEPSSRIKELAKRIIEDHNRDQKDKARRAYLDPKGREYTTKPRHWGAKDPNVPGGVAGTRAMYEWHSLADENRIDRELRVMLQMWYRSKLSREERGKDRTSERAMAIWEENMKAKKGGQELKFNELWEWIGGTRAVSKKPVEVVEPDQFRTPTKEEGHAAARVRAKEEKAKSYQLEREALSKVARSSQDARKPTKMATQARKLVVYDSDESDDGKVLGKPISKHKIPTIGSDDSDPSSRTSSTPPNKKTVSAELTSEQLAGFEQWANAVEADENKVHAPTNNTNERKTQPKPTSEKRTIIAVKATAHERKLLDAMKQKAAEDVQSEGETGLQAEPEEKKSDDEEVPVKKNKKTKTEAKAQTSASKKMNPAVPTKSSKSSVPKSLSPIPEPAAPKPSKTLAPKRKATTSPKSDLPASKKSRKYKSTDIIEDSDDEADYAFPEAPAPVISEQREGWALAETSITESVKVVQTDNVEDDEVPDEVQVVVERGTTIVSEVATTKAIGKSEAKSLSFESVVDASSSSSLDALFKDRDEDGKAEHIDVRVEEVEADETALSELEMEESEESDDGKLVSSGSQHDQAHEAEQGNSGVADVGNSGSDASSLSEPPSSAGEVEEEGKPASPMSPNEKVDAVPLAVAEASTPGSDESSLSEPASSDAESTYEDEPIVSLQDSEANHAAQGDSTIAEIETSDSDESSLSEPSSSDPEADDEPEIPISALRKRKGPFDDDEDDQENVRPARKVKTVKFDEEVYYAIEGKRRMSIPYVLTEGEVETSEGGENVGSEDAISDEEGNVSE